MIKKGIIPVLLLLLTCQYKLSAQVDYKILREEMLRKHIIERGISNSHVIRALRQVERHLFVPEDLRIYAYNDHPLMIGEGQTISQPYIVALMTELISLNKNSKVLEIGTGSGYQAAILGEIAKDVYTIEIIEPLYLRSARLLDSLGYSNIHCKHGDGYQGWEENAPYDAIIVTCAPTAIPRALIEQLAEGGRMIIPVGGQANQRLVLLRKKNGELREKTVAPVLFVPMLRSREQKK